MNFNCTVIIEIKCTIVRHLQTFRIKNYATVRFNDDILIKEFLDALHRGFNIYIYTSSFLRKQESRRKRYWIPHQVRNDKFFIELFSNLIPRSLLRGSSLEGLFDFDGNPIRGYLSKRAQRLIKEWCNFHREELKENWERAKEDKPLNWIEPLR